MSKKQKPAKSKAEPKEKPTAPKYQKRELKSRFYEYVKYEKVPESTVVLIEGNEYFEFKGLRGVYFRKSMFV